ncbi:hypothetical protein C2R22_14765 [Salinigranum rubrum]|uniref:Right handed beta helix domain-containing protein n=1 Tax=Salinigranum rubrum TaxID=755307 RepID=A0A2I8VNR1_9EURY|nr:hypothetical protein [Salinigranum rubrum]AUV82749.1 hypothetical protein C2R22_14765 [Salinigranum rubrum]
MKDSTFVIDHARYDGKWIATDKAFNTRAIRIDQAKNGETIGSYPPKTEPTDPSRPAEERGALIERCDIRVLNTLYDRNIRGAICMNAASQSATIRDTYIQMDAGQAPAVYRVKPGWNFRDDQDTPPKPHWVRLENVTINGSTDNGAAVRVESGDDTVITNCCIHQTGSNRNGIVMNDTANARVEDSNIRVSGEAVVSRSSDVSTQNLTSSDACPIPDVGRGSSGSPSDGTGSPGDGSETGTEHELLVRADAGADVFSYTVRVSGAAEPVLDGTYRANGNEELVTNDDGSTTITGTVGLGGGDTFRFDGTVVSAELSGPGAVFVDDTELDLSTLDGKDENTDGSTGGDSGGSDANTEHELLVRADAGADVFSYTVNVSGSAEPVLDGTYRANGNEELVTNDDGSTTITGTVGLGGGDTFRFFGDVSSAELSGPGAVFVDDTELDLSTLDGKEEDENTDGSTGGGSGGSDEPAYDHELLVRADTGADVFSYTVRVSGAAEPVLDGTYRANDNEELTVHADGSTTITGTVGLGGGDSFRFDGTVVFADLGGPGSLAVDGSDVSLAEVGPDHRLEIVGVPDWPATYEFTVDGELFADLSASGAEENVSGSSAEGSVGEDPDAYLFNGSITDFRVEGDAGVYLDGEQVDPDALDAGTDPSLPNRLVIESAGGTSSYEFEVSGNAEKRYRSATVETADLTSGGYISGSVDGDDVDAYAFSGDIVTMNVTGSGSLTFEDLDG